MGQTRFRVLLSCSFAGEDLATVNFFEELIKSFGFEVVKYDFQEPVPLAEGVKGQIQKADCLIAIATRRHRIQSPDGKEDWGCPEWVTHEVVYAYATGKPVAIFAETGVRLGGLIEREERYQQFTRETAGLLAGVPKFNCFLLALRDTLEQRARPGPDALPVLFYHRVHSRDELLGDGSFVTTCEVELESLVEGLAYCTEGIGDVDWLRAPGDAVEGFEFSVLHAPPRTSISYHLHCDREHPTEWRVVFSPPLPVGARACYAFRYRAKDVRPVALEDAEDAIRDGRYWSDTPESAVNWDFLHRVGEFVCEVLFPANYPVHEPKVRVELSEAGLPAEAEMARLGEANAFEVQRLFDRYSLHLRVHKPILGRYMVTWRPPRRQELPTTA